MIDPYRRLGAAVLAQAGLDLASRDWIIALDAMLFFEGEEARYFLQALDLHEKTFLDIAASYRKMEGKNRDFRKRNFAKRAGWRDR